ncbi:MAG: PAS domain S-box protein [Elusimicrobia bacterium]|nr:PAS domain S-box protein [Elusimicrobiota bacterium]
MSESGGGEHPPGNENRTPLRAGGADRAGKPVVEWRSPAALACLLGAALAVIALAAWAAGWPELGEFGMGVVPMAPSSACAILLLAAAAVVKESRLPPKSRSALGLFLPLLVIAATAPLLWRMIAMLGAEGPAILAQNPAAAAPPFWRMSPLAAGLFLALGSAFFLAGLSSAVPFFGIASSGLGTLTMLASGFLLLGYLYGLPYLDRTVVIPVAFATAASCFLLSFAVLAGYPRRAPARFFAGPSLRAKLLRGFMPLIIISVLANALSRKFLPEASPVLRHGLGALVAILALSVLAAWLAKRIGDSEARAMERLLSSEAKFARLYGQMLDSFVYVDMQGRISGCNAAYERLTGYTLEELKRLTYRDLTPEKWREDEERIVKEEIIPKGTSGVYEKEYRRKDGSLVPVELLTVLDRDPSGKPAGMWAIIRDLTDRKAAARALAGSEEQFRLMFEEHSAVMLLIDPASGEIVRANKAAARFYGHPPEKLRGLKIWEINTLSREEISAIHGRILRGEENFFVFRHRLASGEERTVEVRSSSIPLAGRKLNFEVVHDITERELAERRTLAEKSRAESYLEIVGVLIIALEKDRTVSLVNQKGCEILGYAREEMLGRDWFELAIPPERRGEIKAVFDRVMSGDFKPVEHYENEVVVKGGERRLIAWSNALRRDPDGNVIGLLASGEDITERRKAEDALKRSERDLKEAQRLAKVGSWEFDPATGAGSWTEEVARIHGLDPASPTDMALGLSFYSGASRRAIEAAIKEAVEEGKGYDLELELTTSQGERKWVHTIGRTLVRDGRTARVYGTFQDVTERRRLEDGLRELSRQRQLALDAASLGWWAYDPASRVATYDEGYKKIFEVEGHSKPNDEILKRLHPGDLPGVWAKVEAALDPEAPKPYFAQYRVLMPDGRVKWVEAYGLAVFEGEGREKRAVDFIGTVADITARKHADELLKSYARTLADKNKELEDFLYVASHDLRGPMVNIQGFSQNIGRYCALLSEELKPPEGSRARELLGRDIPEALGFLQGGANRMDALISALLKVSRLGRAELRPERVDMDALIAEISSSMSYQLGEAGGTMKAGPLPPCEGDRLQLPQVFYNLADNALKYRDPARPPVIKIAGEPGTDGFVSYTVSDNGRGLTAEEADGKIWGLFYRSENSAPVPGEGIGLTAAKRIVERHGGTIAASRNAEGGATFTIRLKEYGG